MEQPKGTRTPAGSSQPRQVDDLNNGQAADDQDNRTDETGGGQLTRLQENAARHRAEEPDAGIPDGDSER